MPWAVVAVVGDAEGPAFGYTNGLHGLYDHPELYLTAITSGIGDVEWTPQEIGLWLNELGSMVRDGDPLPAGRAVRFVEPSVGWVIDFQTGPPLPEVLTHGLLVEPGALVLPVRCSIVTGPYCEHHRRVLAQLA